MSYLRKNLYNENLIEAQKIDRTDYYLLSEDEREFVKKYNDLDGTYFFDIRNLSQEEKEIIISLTRFNSDRPNGNITIDELEKIFVECLLDSNKKYGLKIYYLLRGLQKRNEDYLSFDSVYDEDLRRFIVSSKEDYKKYVTSDYNQRIIEDIEIVEKREVNVKKNPIDYYLNDMFISPNEIMKDQEESNKKLEFRLD